MNKKAILIPIIALTSLFSASYLFSPIFAASPSPSPTITPSPASDKEVTDNLKKRLQESLELKETENTQKARAYIGTVKDVIKDTIIIEDKDGKKDIKLERDTIILRSPGSTTIKPENIRIDDYIIAIGYPTEDSTLKGRRLLVSADPIKVPPKTSGIGTLNKISKSSITLKLEDKEQVMDITAKTILKSSVGTIELSDLSVGDTIIYTAKIDENDDLTATILMRTQTSSIAQ